MSDAQEVKFELIWPNNRRTGVKVAVTDLSEATLINHAYQLGTYGQGGQRLPVMVLYENRTLFKQGDSPLDELDLPIDEDEIPSFKVLISRDGGQAWEIFEGPFYDESDAQASEMAARSAGFKHVSIS